MLTDLAEFIAKFDVDKDMRVLPNEYGEAKSQIPLLDTDGDREISRKDARAFLRRIESKRGADPKVSQDAWFEAGGNEATFALLDRDKDGFLRYADFENRPEPHQAEVGTPIVDARNGEKLILDGVRLAWMREINLATRQGSLIWKNQHLSKDLFGNGARASAENIADGKRLYGFASDAKQPNHVALLDDQAKVHVLNKGE
ncbi:MAG: hypothetical protein KDB07_01950, partial [Planctomycetes bacterium]|nr:hypothetical protein [Planctomycetota bacterium]